MADAGGVLDAEYREFVRSLHVSTIATYGAVTSWWHENPCQRVAGSLIGGQTPRMEDVRASAHSVALWEQDVRPELGVLINGHPDPDVRDSATLFGSRIFAAVLLLRPVLAGRDSPPDQAVARREMLGCVYDPVKLGESLRRLHRATRDAPFRIYRPEPTHDRSWSDDTEHPASFPLWLDQLEQRERDYRPAEAAPTKEPTPR